jgi:glycosyltransferase involved in cell wall biosynthesis
MHIAVDLRSLQSGQVSGVENYTLNLLENLLPMDRVNRYTLFYNAWGNSKGADLHFVNSEIKRTSIPNKILNLRLKLGLTNMEQLIGNFDCLFLPNLNQYRIHPFKKMVLTVHDLSPVVTPEFYDLKRRVWHKFLDYRKAFHQAHLIFAVSEHTKMDLMRLFDVPERKIKVVYPGLDHSAFHTQISLAKKREVRNEYNLPGEYLLFLSTVEPRKNLNNLVKAFEITNHPVHLVVVGKPGWKHGGIFKALQQSKKTKKIHYIGYIKESHKAAVISLARAVVYPSFYEGFGFVPLEAAACGVPVIASQVTSLPEVVKDAGLLVDPYKPEDIARAIEQILMNENLSTQLVQKALERVKEFTWEKTARGVLEGLNSLSK